LGKVEEIAKEITAHCIRADIDDSSSTLQKKIREAEQEWIPYIIVVGEKEIASGFFQSETAKSTVCSAKHDAG
jgi:threonyl-tRNA synthetase